MHPRIRLEIIPIRLRPVALICRVREEETRTARVLRESDTARRRLALRAASDGVCDCDLGELDAGVAGVVDVADAETAVRGADYVVCGAGCI